MKAIMTGIVIITFLSFCFGQRNDISNIITEIQNGKSKKEISFLKGLDSISVLYRHRLKSDCTFQMEIYRNYGAHYYYYPELIDKSLQYFQDSAAALANSCEYVDYDYYMQTLMSTNSALKKKGDLKRRKEHIEFLKSKIDESQSENDSINAKVYFQIGKYYREVLKLDQAISWLQRSLAYYNAQDSLHEFALRPMNNYASILTIIGKHDKAIDLFFKVRKLAVELNVESNSNYDERLYSNLANAFERNNQIDSAIFYYNIYFEKAKNSNSVVLQSNLFQKKSILNYYKEQYNESLNNINKAIEILENSSDGYVKQGLNYLYLLKSIFLNSAGNYELALETSFVAMKKSSYGLSSFPINKSLLNNLVIQAPHTYLDAAIEYFKAFSKIEENKHIDIINLWKVFEDQFFEIQRQSFGNNNKNSFPPLHHALCRELLNYIFTNKLEDKFKNLTAYCISNSKSIPLYESLSESNLLPKEIQKDYELLNKQQAELNSQIALAESINDKDKISELFKKNYDLNQKKINLYNIIDKLGVDINFNNNRENFVEQTQSSLSETEGLIEYFYSDNFIYRYVLSSNQIKLDRFINYDIYKTDFTSLFASTKHKDIVLMESQIDTFSFLVSNLEWPDDIEDLLIIPDGRLFYLPFDILKNKEENLIQKFNIKYQFALKITDNYNSDLSKPKMEYVGFGTAYNDSELQEIKQSDKIYIMFRDSFNLSKLPKAEQEINNLSDLFNGSEYLNTNCTIDNFYKNARNAKVVHISNHVLLNEINSDLTSIVFSSNDSISLINTYDIKKMSINANLAILSSCNSGTGSFINGVGIKSLGYAFTASGCPSVLVNLWEASDKSSNYIITQFANYLKKGKKKSTALRLAKLDYLESVGQALKHPKYWANMLLIGDDMPIQFSNAKSVTFYYFIIALIILCISILGLIFIQKHRRKNSPA